MPLLYVVGVLLLVAVLLWAINAFPYADAGVKKVIQIIVVVVAAIWVIGLIFHVGPGSLSQLHVGK